MAVSAVTLKLLLSFLLIFFVSFTSANSCCYSFFGEISTDTVSNHYTSSLWEFYYKKNILACNAKFTLRLLLILAGDIETCPGPRARCTHCSRCFRRNIDKRTCVNCKKVFHKKCLNDENIGLVCLQCQPFLTVDTQTTPVTYTLNELESLYHQKGLKVVHQNVRGLFSKKDELYNILKQYPVDIFGVTESFLSVCIPTSFLKITGYVFERRDRTSGIGGGVGAYIKEGTPYIRRKDLEHEDIECIFIEICYEKSSSFIVGFLYKPPDSSNHLTENFTDKLASHLATIDAENKETIILGDINCDYLKRNDHSDIKELFTLNGYSQLINSATRITQNSATLIDVILTNFRQNISLCNVIPTNLSDHDMVGCVRKINRNKAKPKTITCRNYAKYDKEAINVSLSCENWDAIYNSKCPEKAWEIMKAILVRTLDQWAPFVTKRVKGDDCPWLNDLIKKEMNTRDKLMRKARRTKKDIDWSNYKRKRNFVINAIKRAKKLHYTNLLNESASAPEKFWRSIKEIFPTKSKSQPSSCSIIINGEKTCDNKTIANGFCKFFSSAANTLKRKAFPLTNCVWKYNKKHNIRPKTAFNFTNVPVREVNSHLKKLKRKKATGLDNLPAKFLRDTADSIASPLTHIINLSLQSSVIPNDFKSGRVLPLFKSGSVSDTDNYRPITILPILSKVLEKCVHNQLMTYLEENNLLCSQQFGFRKKRSTELAATCFVDDIRKNIDKGCYTGAFYIDLRKAFDTISHVSILSKLYPLSALMVSQKIGLQITCFIDLNKLNLAMSCQRPNRFIAEFHRGPFLAQCYSYCILMKA